MSFVTTLADRNASLGHQICVGIDPPFDTKAFDKLPFFTREWRSSQLKFVENFAAAAVDAAGDTCSMVKFQSAYFEACGHEGMRILADQIKRAKEKNLLVLWDAKRGDISTTMHAYGYAAFEVLGADALTATPYMGEDVYSPLAPWLKSGKGVYVVWTTSNPGAAALQDARLADGSSVTDEVFHRTTAWFREHQLESSLGFVLGVTRFGSLSEAVRPALQQYSVLMPGVGPQGGQFTDELRAFIRQCPGCSIPMSRGLTGLGDPSQIEGLQSVTDWDAYRSYIHDRISLATSHSSC